MFTTLTMLVRKKKNKYLCLRIHNTFLKGNLGTNAPKWITLYQVGTFLRKKFKYPLGNNENVQVKKIHNKLNR